MAARHQLRSARLIQRRWRSLPGRSAESKQALRKIQALTKGHLEREHLKAERQWAEESEAEGGHREFIEILLASFDYSRFLGLMAAAAEQIAAMQGAASFDSDDDDDGGGDHK